MTAPSRPDAGAAGQTSRDHGGLLSVLDSVQREIEALKAAGMDAERRTAELAAREAQFMAKEAALRDRAAEIESERSALDQAKGAFERRGAELDQREQACLESLQQAEQARAETESMRRQLADASTELEQRESDLTRREAALQEATGQVQQELQRARTEAEEAVESRLRLEEAAKERAAEHEQTLLRLRSDLETAKKREANASSKLSDLQKQLEQARSAAAAGDSKSSEAVTRLQKQVAEHDSERARLTQALEAAAQELEALRTQAAARAEASESASGLEQELAQRDERCAELDEALREARAEIESLRNEADRARAQARSFEGIDIAATPFNESRRARLERMKSLLEERAKKVLRAKKALEERARDLEALSEQKSGDAAARDREAMQQRSQEANRVMAERAAIAQERTTLAALIERAQTRASRSQAAGIMFLFFATMLTIAAGAWVVAGHFAPATYLAQSRISMEQGGRSGDPAAVRAWTEFHQTLASDPQVVERTADRLRRFGFTDLSTPGEVGAYIGDNLEVAPGAKGEVALTLKGVGGSRTERILSTLTESVVAMANESRDRRLDRTGTVIAAAAALDEQPVADPRFELFGIIAGGAALFAFMVWLVAWRTLARRKPLIETEAAVATNDWSTA